MTLVELECILARASQLPWTWDYAKPGWLLGAKPEVVPGGRTIKAVLDGIADEDDCNVAVSDADRDLIAAAVNTLPVLLGIAKAAAEMKEKGDLSCSDAMAVPFRMEGQDWDANKARGITSYTFAPCGKCPECRMLVELEMLA